jgi:hypothetical protein
MVIIYMKTEANGISKKSDSISFSDIAMIFPYFTGGIAAIMADKP